MRTHRELGMGLVGPGFIAEEHIEAVRRLGDVRVVALAGSSAETARHKARRWNVPRSYGSYNELLMDVEVDVVHNTTPNYLHFPVSMAAIAAGKHVISDKPLAMTVSECEELTRAAARAGVCAAVTFNYRGSAMVEEMRARIAAGEAGTLVFLHGCYLQDWMTDERVYSWRMDASKGGPSSALADIGTHWCDLVEYVSGLQIEAVLADMTTVVSVRYSNGASDEAFTVKGGLHDIPVPIRGEDLAVVLLRFNNGALGSLSVGQILPGHKNGLMLEINGRKCSLRWRQEQQNELWIGHHDGSNALLLKDPALLTDAARPYARLPGGHQEGWPDAFRNVLADIYRWIRKPAYCPPNVCTFGQATRTASIVEAMLTSYARGGVWTPVKATCVSEGIKELSKAAEGKERRNQDDASD